MQKRDLKIESKKKNQHGHGNEREDILWCSGGKDKDIQTTMKMKVAATTMVKQLRRQSAKKQNEYDLN